MQRLLSSLVLLCTLTATAYAVEPSLFANPTVNFSLLRRVALIGFTVDATNVQDPFASQKANVYLTTGLRTVGLSMMDMNNVLQRIQADTGIDMTKQLTQSELDRVVAEMAKHLDAVLTGRIGVWGTFQQSATRIFPVYSWHSDGTWGYTNIPVRSSREMSAVGASVALLRLGVPGGWELAWQYSHVRIHEGGYDLLHRAPPDPPDRVAEAFFLEVAKALPIRP